MKPKGWKGKRIQSDKMCENATYRQKSNSAIAKKWNRPGQLMKIKKGLKAGINNPFYVLECQTKLLFLSSLVNMKLLNN